MENEYLNVRFLDTAIKAMERNRTLLFAINLIAALVLVVVYLENFSFDKRQREGHLIAYGGHCKDLNNSLMSIPNWSTLSEDDKKSFSGCSDLNKMRGFVVANSGNRDLEAIGKELLKLNMIQNEVNSAKLETAYVTPLGFGILIPRNDLFVICGVLLVILYTWLAFSFEQLARVIRKIKQCFAGPKDEDGDETKASVTDLVELNFMFRTSRGGFVTILVKALYWLAPIAMSIATLNNMSLDTTKSYHDYLNSVKEVPMMAQAAITVVLWIIGFNVNRSDNEAKVPQTKVPTTQE